MTLNKPLGFRSSVSLLPILSLLMIGVERDFTTEDLVSNSLYIKWQATELLSFLSDIKILTRIKNTISRHI